MTATARIDNALLVDGSGLPGFPATVAIAGDRIAAIGPEAEGPAHRIIDADGAVLAPGFIDLHTHTDFTLPVYPRAAAMVTQGVTTQLTGNCGFSPFPIDPVHREALIEYTSFIDAGLAWDEWDDAAGFAAHLERLPLATNVALQVGLGTVRLAVMGFDRRPATAAEMARMEQLVVDSFAAGVAGVSSGLVYPPGSFADVDELAALVSVAARLGGCYSTHMRNESALLLEAVAEALEIGRRSGAPVQLSHHKVLGREHWGLVERSLAMIDVAIESGQDVLADQYPYRAGSTGFTQVLPGWALEGGVAAMQARLGDPGIREKILESMRGGSAPEVRVFDPDGIVLAQVPDGRNHRYEGMRLSEVAAARGEDAAETALLLLAEEGAGIVMLVFGMAEEDVRRVMRHPAVAVASDGWTLSPDAGGRPHPRSYGTFARVLGEYVRSEAVLDLETAVHKMSGLPARRLPGLGVGLVRRGYRADLVIFDPARVRDVATYADPHRFCEGVQHVVVGGQLVVDDGEDTGLSPGRVLRA